MYQYLYQDPDNPAVGWGFSADVAISDGNPNPIKWRAIGGLAGQGLLPGREQDRWGIGYFKYGLSNDLVTGLARIGSALETDDPTFYIGDEQGVEIFYDMALTPWLRLTGDLQWIDPHEVQREDTYVAAVRMQTRF